MSQEKVISRCELTGNESLTVMDMIQDCIERGMISSSYDTGRVEKLISETTDEFDSFKPEIEFEITITVKKKSKG